VYILYKETACSSQQTIIDQRRPIRARRGKKFYEEEQTPVQYDTVGTRPIEEVCCLSTDQTVNINLSIIRQNY